MAATGARSARKTRPSWPRRSTRPAPPWPRWSTLLPEATLPEVVREVRSAVAWLYRNAAAYGVDPARIYVSGSSAGGHLAGMLAAPDWQARYGVPDDVIKGTLA